MHWRGEYGQNTSHRVHEAVAVTGNGVVQAHNYTSMLYTIPVRSVGPQYLTMLTTESLGLLEAATEDEQVLVMKKEMRCGELLLPFW